METETIVIAKILGPLYILAGIVFLGRPKMVQKIVKEFLREEEELFQWGMVSFVIGIVVLQFHFLWNTFPEILVSFLGVFAVVKGILFVFLPRLTRRLTQKSIDLFIIFGAFLSIIIGMYFFKIIYT